MEWNERGTGNGGRERERERGRERGRGQDRDADSCRARESRLSRLEQGYRLACVVDPCSPLGVDPRTWLASARGQESKKCTRKRVRESRW